MKTRLTQISVQNIYHQAKDEEVRRLLESCGPIVDFKPRREQETKFSAEAEYYDEYNAMIAVEMLNGYNFQNRQLKVKLQGPPQIPTILPYAIEKVNYRTSDTYDILSVTDKLDHFYASLIMNKKVALFAELKLAYNNPQKQALLADLLSQNPAMADLILKIQNDVLSLKPELSKQFVLKRPSQ